jgi:hypothetical protein
MKDIIKEYIGELTQYMTDNGVNTYPLPRVQLRSDPAEAEGLFGKTGYYDPNAKCIVLYIHGRHPKDVLRSFAHEMIHHDQNLSGEMTSDKMGEDNDPKYTQNNPHMRKLEEDAYKRGNMMFRDWTDNKKYGK